MAYERETPAGWPGLLEADSGRGAFCPASLYHRCQARQKLIVGVTHRADASGGAHG
jgi:hypothetical protein